MTREVIRISAIGTRGAAKGKQFLAKPDSSGRFVLNKKRPASSANPTNKSINKVYAKTLTEAAALLATDEYLINVVCAEGKRALREYSGVDIEYK
jgi:hypothetical protein